MSWQQIYDSTFFLALCGSIMAGFGLAVKYCHRSKCSEIGCCGCIKVTRDIRSEVEIEEFEGDSRNESKKENVNNV